MELFWTIINAYLYMSGVWLLGTIMGIMAILAGYGIVRVFFILKQFLGFGPVVAYRK